MHPLDNVIWEALRTRQADLGESLGLAARFSKEVSVLAGISEHSDRAFADLASLLKSGERAALFLENADVTAPILKVVHLSGVLQMVHERAEGSLDETSPPISQLGEADVPEMLALTKLTQPGPFGRRTREMGDYFGIRQNGRLAAMAGERLKVLGFSEVSAVCTHPDYLGRGYARSLISLVVERIQRQGETPFLHVRPENSRAIGLYERLGFRVRHERRLVVVEKE